MMCWSWINSSREREALTISCPGHRIASLPRCTARPGQKIAKTTPCKVGWTPARSTLAAAKSGCRRAPAHQVVDALVLLGRKSEAPVEPHGRVEFLDMDRHRLA